MNNKPDFNTLFEETMPILYKYRVIKEERRKRGEDFNIFRTLRMQYDEVHTHSAMISALLNPKEYHGCKFSFLRAFLHQIKELKIYEDKISDLDNAVIEVEKSIGNISQDKENGGRLDILIKLYLHDEKLPVLIIIENKIYAADEEKQLVRYYNYAKRKSCSNYYIFYLTLDGRLPSENSTGKMLECDKDYYCLSYRNDILNWLCDCQKEANGKPLVHGIITQYKDLVSFLTHQNMDMDTQIKLASKIAENSEYMILASIINDNYKHILHQMCELRLNDLCKRVAQNLNLNCKHYGQWGNKYSGVSFTKEQWQHFSVSFEFMKDNLDCFCFGVKYLASIKEQKSETEKAILSKCVQDEFEKDLFIDWQPWHSNEYWWPWYFQDKKYPNWTREYAIKALYNGAIESHISDEIKKIAEKVDTVEHSLTNNN